VPEAVRAFTLIELMVVVALMGVAVATAVLGMRAWQRSSNLQKAVSDVSALLERAASETLDRRVPYRIAATATGLAGARWRLDAAKASASLYVDSPPDRTVTCGVGVKAVPLAKAGTDGAWILERGVPEMAFTVHVWHRELFPAGWAVTLDPTGRVEVAATTIGPAPR
jgi:prepilin-type N-terminal cleavage/methylation domain-containing protein